MKKLIPESFEYIPRLTWKRAGRNGKYEKHVLDINWKDNKIGKDCQCSIHWIDIQKIRLTIGFHFPWLRGDDWETEERKLNVSDPWVHGKREDLVNTSNFELRNSSRYYKVELQIISYMHLYWDYPGLLRASRAWQNQNLNISGGNIIPLSHICFTIARHINAVSTLCGAGWYIGVKSCYL